MKKPEEYVEQRTLSDYAEWFGDEVKDDERKRYLYKEIRELTGEVFTRYKAAAFNNDLYFIEYLEYTHKIYKVRKADKEKFINCWNWYVMKNFGIDRRDI